MAKDCKLEVLSIGLPRTGTASIAQAYRILGYKSVHHGLYTITDSKFWIDMEHAVDATFHTLPTYHGGDAQLERIFGGYDVITDFSIAFAEELISRHPNAKVVLTTRDFDSWARSMTDVLLHFQTGVAAWLLRNIIEPLTGDRMLTALFKIFRGFFQTDPRKICYDDLREAYDKHHELVNRLVPKERLLVWRVSDGWEPLCNFLEKPVPELAFPRVNDARHLKKTLRDLKHKLLLKAIMKLSVMISATAAAYWAYRTKLSR